MALVFYFLEFLKLEITYVRIIYRISLDVVNEIDPSGDTCEIPRATALYNIMLALSGDFSPCIRAVLIATLVLRLEIVSSPERATLSFVCSNKEFSPLFHDNYRLCN